MEKISFGNTWYYFLSSDVLETKISNLDLTEKTTSLSNLLEIYKLKTWYVPSETQSTELQATLKKLDDKLDDKLTQLKGYVGKSLASKSADDWMNEYLESKNEKQNKYFYDLFSEYTIWGNLSEEVFKQFLWEGHASLSILLEDKKVVRQFSNVIKDSLINDEEMLLCNIPMISDLVDRKRKLYFPDGFEGSDGFQLMVNKLVDSLESMNIRDIAYIQPLLDFHMSEFPLNEETRSRLEQYVSEFWASQKQSAISPATSWQISIDKIQKKPVEFSLNGRTIHVKISEPWLKSIPKKDFLLTMIESFAIDQHIRPVSIIHPQVSNNDTYNLYEMFNSNNFKGSRMYRDDLIMMMADKQLFVTVAAIIDYLINNDSSMEQLISDYFNKQVFKNHGIEGFSMIEVDSKLPTNIKIKLLAIELESILKQFKLLVEYGKIDLDNLAYMDGLDIDIIPSLIPNKFLQRKENIEISDSTFASLFVTHNYCHGYLLSSVSREGLDLTNFKEYSKLFSDDESNFLSYCLNNKKYDNALAIRNNYLHGSTINFSEEQHQSNYIELIKVFWIVIAKLEEEFVWKEDKQKELKEKRTE